MEFSYDSTKVKILSSSVITEYRVVVTEKQRAYLFLKPFECRRKPCRPEHLAGSFANEVLDPDRHLNASNIIVMAKERQLSALRRTLQSIHAYLDAVGLGKSVKVSPELLQSSIRIMANNRAQKKQWGKVMEFVRRSGSFVQLEIEANGEHTVDAKIREAVTDVAALLGADAGVVLHLKSRAAPSAEAMTNLVGVITREKRLLGVLVDVSSPRRELGGKSHGARRVLAGNQPGGDACSQPGDRARHEPGVESDVPRIRHRAVDQPGQRVLDEPQPPAAVPRAEDAGHHAGPDDDAASNGSHPLHQPGHCADHAGPGHQPCSPRVEPGDDADDAVPGDVAGHEPGDHVPVPAAGRRCGRGRRRGWHADDAGVPAAGDNAGHRAAGRAHRGGADVVRRQDGADRPRAAERGRLRVRHRASRLLGHPAHGRLLQPQHPAGARLLRLQQLLPEEPVADELRLRRRRHARQRQPK